MDNRRSAIVAAVFGAVSLFSGSADAVRAPVLATVVRDAPSNLGIVAALDRIREDREFYQVRVTLDNGSAETIIQERLNDLRVGDRVEIDSGQAYRHDTRADRIDRWGYRVDAAGNRYDDEGLRIDDAERN